MPDDVLTPEYITSVCKLLKKSPCTQLDREQGIWVIEALHAQLAEERRLHTETAAMLSDSTARLARSDEELTIALEGEKHAQEQHDAALAKVVALRALLSEAQDKVLGGWHEPRETSEDACLGCRIADVLAQPEATP